MPTIPHSKSTLLLRYASGVIVGVIICLALRMINFALYRAQQPGVTKSPEEALAVEKQIGYKSGQSTIVEFLDFECGPCRTFWPNVRDFQKMHPGVRWVIVNCPLPVHPNAFSAAVCFDIARKYGHGEAMADLLMSGNITLSTKSLNCNLARFGLIQPIGSPRASLFGAEVQKEMRLARDLGVRGTPALFVLSKNGILTEVESLGAAELFLE